MGFSAGKGTGGDDEENVEHGAADDCSDSHVGDGDEDADDGGEELWRRSAGRHEGGTGYIVADPPPFNDDVEGGDEVVVADEGEGVEHVEQADHVQDDRST